MAKKLIQTNFTYTAEWYNGTHSHLGGYLGRKPATLATLRRFLNRNARTCGTAFKLLSVEIFSSHESQWVAK